MITHYMSLAHYSGILNTFNKSALNAHGLATQEFAYAVIKYGFNEYFFSPFKSESAA